MSANVPAKSDGRRGAGRPPILLSEQQRAEALSAIAEGALTRDVAKRLGMHRHTLVKKLTDTAEGEAAYRAAQRAAARALAEDAQDLLDKAAKRRDVTSAQAALHRARAEHRRWRAERLAPEEFAGSPAVVLNVGALHLDALRQVGNRPQPVIEYADFELVEDED